MRLWHRDLIHYLPRQQLIAQWRECYAIASNIANKGTINVELAEEACRRWKLYKHQLKTGKPARVKIQHPFGDFIVGGNVL